MDTSTPAVTAGLVAWEDSEPRSLAERVTVHPRAHGELLMPQLLEILAETGRQLADVDAIVVGSGPGPFTGLRVGMVTAAALGHASGRRVHPVCSLDAVAAQVVAEAPVLVATDARRKEVYWARYDASGRRRSEPAVDFPAAVASDGPVAGRGPSLYPDAFPTAVGPQLPRAADLARLVVSGGADLLPASPLYLRRPDVAHPGERKRVS
jgi:tRNA threonylcarbamoyl adenosine modification protein YeaZ